MAIVVPPLRERLDDLSVLMPHILSRLQVQLNRRILGLSPGFTRKLHAHNWPGNVRELQHVLLHAALLEDAPLLEGQDFRPTTTQPSTVEASSARPAQNNPTAFRLAVQRAMQENKGNKSRAAAALGVTRRTLYKWLKDSD